MGIKFTCEACGKRIHVKDFLAGKRGICPNCQARVQIPLKSQDPPSPAMPTSSVANDPDATVDYRPGRETTEIPPDASPAALESPPAEVAMAAPPTATPIAGGAPPTPAALPADPIAEAPQMQWYVMPAGSQTPYGPATGDMLRQWVAERRVSPDSLVWRQDWPDWRRAASVLPLAPPPQQTVVGVPVAAGLATPGRWQVPVAASVLTEPTATTGAEVVVLRRRGNWGRLVLLTILVGIIALLTPLVYKTLVGALRGVRRPASPARQLNDRWPNDRPVVTRVPVPVDWQSARRSSQLNYSLRLALHARSCLVCSRLTSCGSPPSLPA